MIDPDQLKDFVNQHCTDKEKEAIDLCWIQGYGIKRAADKLGISPRTLRDRLDTARDRISRQHQGTT